jgi:hypothetical protein
MTPAEAAWVRENVWTSSMRVLFKELPGFYLTCACQHSGPCTNAKDPGRHKRCHVGQHPLLRYETIISGWDGTYGVAFPTPYRFPTADATSWKYSRMAMVWLADRQCRWACSCDCGHPRGDIAHDPRRNPMRPITYELVALPGLDLFAEVAA